MSHPSVVPDKTPEKAPEKPQEIAPQVVRELEPENVPEGASVTLSCEITGQPRPKTFWYVEGREIVPSKVGSVFKSN